MLSPFMGKISVKLACFSRDCSVKPPTLGPYWKSLTHMRERGEECGGCVCVKFLFLIPRGSAPSFLFCRSEAAATGVEGNGKYGLRDRVLPALLSAVLLSWSHRGVGCFTE